MGDGGSVFHCIHRQTEKSLVISSCANSLHLLYPLYPDVLPLINSARNVKNFNVYISFKIFLNFCRRSQFPAAICTLMGVLGGGIANEANDPGASGSSTWRSFPLSLHSSPSLYTEKVQRGGGAEVAKPPHWKVHRMYTRNEDTECTAAFALDCNRVGCRVGLRVCVCVCVYNTVYEDHDDDGACGPLPERPVFVRSVIYVLV